MLLQNKMLLYMVPGSTGGPVAKALAGEMGLPAVEVFGQFLLHSYFHISSAVSGAKSLMPLS